jgi:hypothetical protein
MKERKKVYDKYNYYQDGSSSSKQERRKKEMRIQKQIYNNEQS